MLSITLAVALVMAVGAGSASAEKELTLIYYDGHMHTTRSDGEGEVADIKVTAQDRGLSAVIITDHCKSLDSDNWASLIADCEDASDCEKKKCDFLALPGFEVTGSEGMFNRDHINAYGVDDPFVSDEGCDNPPCCPEEIWPSPENPAGTGPMDPENLAKWVDYIHANGGIAVHNHPSGTTTLGYGVNNLEVYNQSHVDDVATYAMQLGYSEQQAWEFGILLNGLAVYGEVEELNAQMPNPGLPSPPCPSLPAMMPLRDILFWATFVFDFMDDPFNPPWIGQWLGAPEAPLSSWDELLMAYVNDEIDTPIFGSANSDDHNTGTPESKVGVAKNGAYVEKLTRDDLYKAIKAGRTFATTGPSLALDVNGEHMGGTAYVLSGIADINLSVNSESATAILLKIDIIKNGDAWQTIGPMSPIYEATLADDAVTDGYYRVEVTSCELVPPYYDTCGSYYFAWSNPVFVEVIGEP
jgi:hypothetical protein